MHVLLVFAVLNPLVIPFALIYFIVERSKWPLDQTLTMLNDVPAAVVKNQLLHVYAKNYEGNGKVLLIRMVRYSLDGL